jgi:hypothetical protein
VVRELIEADLAGNRQGTQLYVELARRCLAGLEPVAPLPAWGPGAGARTGRCWRGRFFVARVPLLRYG